MRIKTIVLSLLALMVAARANAQFTDSSTGLLLMPTAEMQKDGTFMITNNWLNRNTLPPSQGGGEGWGYDTFGYGFSITFLSRLEICYVCTIIDGSRAPGKPDEYWRVMFNQDRHFSARVQIFKEGEFGLKWMPALAAGISDPVTGAGTDYIGSDVSSGNGYFNRMYIVLTKHFQTPVGEIGLHAGYQYSFRKDRRVNAPCAGINWKPGALQNRWFSPDIIAEFDSRTFNVGFVAEIWDDRFEAMFLLQDMQWVTAGLRFKVTLKK